MTTATTRTLSPICLSAGPHPRDLTERQAEILGAILEYCRLIPSGCPSTYIAARFHLHHETVRRDYFAVLHRKGWLLTDNSPAHPRPGLLR